MQVLPRSEASPVKLVLFLCVLFFNIESRAQCQPYFDVFPFKTENNRFTLVNRDGTFIDSIKQYEFISDMITESGFFASNGKKYGMINKDFDTLLDFTYDTLFRTNNFIIGTQNDTNQLISCTGKILYTCFDSIVYINENHSKIYFRGKTGLIDAEAQLIVPVKFDGLLVQGQFAFTLNNNLFGAFSINGEELFKPEWPEVIYHNDTIIKAWNGRYWIYHNNRNVTIDPGCNCPLKFEYNGYYTILRDSVQYLYNYSNQKLISTAYEDYFPLANGRIVVRKNKKVALCDNNMKILVEFKYEQINWIGKNAYAVANKLKYGVINETGKEIIPLKYNHINQQQPWGLYSYSLVDRDYITLFEGDKLGIADYEGNIIIKPAYPELYLEDEFVIFSDGSNYGLMNYSEKIIVPCAYPTYRIINDQIVKFKKGNLQIACTKNSIITKQCENIFVTKTTVKCYRGNIIEIIDYEGSTVTDRYSYENTFSYVVKDAYAENWITNHSRESEAIVYRNQLNSKWGVRKRFAFEVTVSPAYDEIIPDKYAGFIAIRPRKDTLTLTLPGLKLFTTLDYHLISQNSINEDNRFVMTDYRNDQSNCNQSGDSDFSIAENGKTNFTHGQLEQFNYSENPEWCVMRFYTNGEMLYNPKSNVSDISLNRFYNRINFEHHLRFTDPTTVKNLYTLNPSLELKNGIWQAYEQFSRLNRAKVFNGSQKFRQLLPFKDSLAVFSQDDENFGIVHIDNKLVLAPEYLDIRRASFGESCVYVVKQDSPDLQTIALPHEENNNTVQNLIIPEGCTMVKLISDSIFACNVNDKYDLYNTTGTKLTNYKFDNVFASSNEMIRFELNGGTGFIGKSHRTTEALSFDQAADFFQGMAWVKKDKQEYLVNKTGEIIYKVRDDESYMGNNIICSKGKKAAIVFIPGTKWKITGVERAYSVTHHRLLIQTKSGFEFYVPGTNKKSETYKKAEPFKSIFTLVSKDGKLFNLIDTSFKTVYAGVESFKDYGEVIWVLASDGKKVFLDRSGNELKSLENFKVETIFTNDIAVARNKTGNRVYINTKGLELFNHRFEEITPFKWGYAAVKVHNNHWGVINTKGELIIAPVHYEISILNKDLAQFRPFPLTGLYDHNGKKLFDPAYNEIKPLSATVFKLTLNGETRYVNQNGTTIGR